MNLADFDYHLPPERIAQEPSNKREESRLLVLDRKSGQWEHRPSFAEIVSLLKEGDVLALNDTRVIQAKLLGKRKSGGKVDALVVSFDRDQAIAMIQTARRPKCAETYLFGPYCATVVERLEKGWRLDFQGVEVCQVMDEIGSAPLPPYIKRKDCPEGISAQDRQRYQTVYAENPGAIAAPTAGLHFTKGLLEELRGKGVQPVYLTLHVGIGTFLPVKSERVEEHDMAYERYRISEESATILNKALDEGRRIVATGTTSCRTLETAGRSGRVVPGEGETGLFIYPGFEYKIVNALITNFHLPKSTLILLVSAFAGRENILRAYQEAISQKYRFYSYGDAMFIH